ncbi:hypothetical protein J6590_106583, partial [Homalodisca vitripennis]
ENDQLSLESTNDAAVVRDKRTVGFLRQAFPTLSQLELVSADRFAINSDSTPLDFASELVMSED